MTATFFPDDSIGCLILGIICYLAILLNCYLAILYNATSSAIRGARRATPEALVSVLFVGLVPVPSAPAVVYAIQFSLVLLMLGSLGVLQVRFALLRSRAVHAYAAGEPARPISLLLWVLVAAPALIVCGYPVVRVNLSLVRAGGWDLPIPAEQAPAVLDRGLLYVFAVAAVFGSYMAAAWVLDQTWLRVVGRIRLLSADARFVWINLLMGVISIIGVGLMLLYGGGTSIAGYVLIAVLALSLTPAINGLSWVYDAVFRRLLILHVLLIVGATLVLCVHSVAGGLGFSGGGVWWVSLGVVVVVALVLPARLDALLERFFFPRSGRMRARLVEIATEPLRAVNRADAGAELLRRLVQVLDSEGGIFVAGAAGSEPAVVHCVGRVDANVIGGSPAEAAQYVATLPLSGNPCVIENLSLVHQLRLLEAGVVFVCPLAARRGEAALLLGPRHGWLFDVATVNALRVFASQAGLALENLALASARAHAEKLAALGEAAARIAHEIRNPLSAARSLVQLAGAANGVGELTAPAITELDRIGQLVTDLLAFARREDALTRAPVDLAAVCRAALTQVATLAQEAGVVVHVALDQATVDGDANRLVQVVANLCRNAIEALATSTTPRQLHLACSAVDGCAYVEVRDTGPGIPPADLPRIFEPFATTKSAGTGLGLPIARRIVEAHGGALAVESTPGAETVFRVALPLVVR